MQQPPKTLKERRAESDTRIIASAIRLFGQRGYTGSSIQDIAKGAGITGGLITQRFGTKENLFLCAYSEVMRNAFTEIGPTASPRECLCSIINDIQKMSDSAPEAFEFCCMLHNAADYPKEILKPKQLELKSTHAYQILKAAQEEGMLPDGEIDLLLASFGSIVFHNTRLCRRYHLDFPEAEKYLEWIHFVDHIVQDNQNWNRILKTAIANTFDVLIYINLAKNTAEMIKCSDHFAHFGRSSNARADLFEMVRKAVPEEERARLHEYLNLDTLSDRLKGRKSLSCRWQDREGQNIIHTFLPISWDENGALTEVFAGMYRIANQTEPADAWR